jgi:hypothetical protein
MRILFLFFYICTSVCAVAQAGHHLPDSIEIERVKKAIDSMENSNKPLELDEAETPKEYDPLALTDEEKKALEKRKPLTRVAFAVLFGIIFLLAIRYSMKNRKTGG